MDWSVAEAKRRFSEVLREASREPQRVYSRSRLVAAIVDPASLGVLLEHRRQTQTSLADDLGELRTILAEEGGAGLEPSRREDRANAFAAVLDELEP